MLDEIIANKSLTCKASIGFYKANTVDDDTIEISKLSTIKMCTLIMVMSKWHRVQK
jgi:cobalamin-dependent methionine synthase I